MTETGTATGEVHVTSNDRTVSVPAHVAYVAPHPDDVAIATGALVLATTRTATSTMVLATDGSEARIPPHVLAVHGHDPDVSPAQLRAARGRVRVAEAREEAQRLGISDDRVVLLSDQTWHTHHQTPGRALHDDLSLSDVTQFRPGPITQQALDAGTAAILAAGTPQWLVIPHPADRLLMHRIVTGVCIVAAEQARSATPGADIDLVFYETLSTTEFSTISGAAALVVGFDNPVMAQKANAIRAHQSMFARRRLYGGYSTQGSEGYDQLARTFDAATSATVRSAFPFAERYQLVASDGARGLEPLGHRLLHDSQEEG